MAIRVDPDTYGSASLEGALENLTGPLTAAAVSTPLSLSPAGTVEVNWNPLRPIVIVKLAISLDTESVSISLTLDPDGVPSVLPPVQFNSYSESGASLLLYASPVGVGAQTVAPFTLGISVQIQPEYDLPQPVPVSDIPGYLTFEVVEGNVGKMLFLLGAEKARVRREARYLSAMKLLASARQDALDRIGADLGVLRFQDDLVYDSVQNEILTKILVDSSGNPTLESDTDFARRLSIYRPFQLSTRERFLEVLNGPGKATDPNDGLISGLGVTKRFLVNDQDNPFALAFRIVGAGSETPRDNFLAYVRSDILIWLPNTATADAVHAIRYIPAAQQTEITELRNRLQTAYTFPADAAVAPQLAEALDRLGRMLSALEFGSQVAISRAQDDTAGSRYELGLGVDIASLKPTDLDTLVAAVNNLARVVTSDTEAESLINAARSMPPASSADEPDGDWLFGICGFQTIHRLDPNTIYISHLPILGLEIDGPDTVPLGSVGDFEAHFYPADDPNINAALFAGLQAGAAEWVADGEAAWTQFTTAEQSTVWGQVIAQPSNAPAQEVFAAAGLPAISNPAILMTSLASVPSDMLATISLDNALAAEILVGAPAAIGTLQKLKSVFGAQSLASAVPLVTSTNAVILVLSVLGLPQVGINIGERRASGFRWYVVPLGGTGSAKGFGSSTSLQAESAGAIALVCLGYVREGLADPYEVLIDLPTDSVIDIKQYEFLMNVLQQIYPTGVQINTYSIRQSHVDLDGDGVSEPLPPSIFRTYRSFQRRKLRGVY